MLDAEKMTSIFSLGEITGVKKQEYESYGAHFQRLEETISISSTLGK
jgi:hypothetical protein